MLRTPASVQLVEHSPHPLSARVIQFRLRTPHLFQFTRQVPSSAGHPGFNRRRGCAKVIRENRWEFFVQYKDSHERQGMEFRELVEMRQSVRVYRRGAVDLDKLTEILEVTNRAPSAGNFQAYEIYVVPQAKLKELQETTFDQKFVGEADVALVVCTHAARCQYDNPDIWAMQDASIATTFAMLAIADLGLATCWVGAFKVAEVAKVIEAPEGIVPMAILPIAGPGEQPERTTRRALPELVHRVG
jgi:nitroreductase